MIPRTTSITETAAWVASRTRSIDVLLTGYVTQIDVIIDLTVSAASSAASLAIDAPYNCMTSLKFTASNWKDWMTYIDGRQAYWDCYLKSQGNAVEGTLPTAGESDTVTMQFSMHPGSNFGNRYDLTRCIPLRGRSNVQMKVTWGASTSIGTGYTITDGELSIVVHRMVLGEGQSEKAAFAPLDNLMVPRYIPVSYNIDGTYANYTFSKNVPTGAYMRDLMLMICDSDGDRSNSDVTKLAVSDNKGNTPIEWDSWTNFVRAVRQQLYLPSTPTGVGMLFFKDVKGDPYGLNMVGANLGDWSIDMTTEAEDGDVYGIYEGADAVPIDPTEVG